MAGLNIPYETSGTGLHSKILKAILERVRLSESEMSNHFDRWRKAEKYYMLYKKTAKTGATMEGGEDYESVVMPYSYANLLTAHTYMVNVFLNKTPVFQVEGSNGEGVDKELSMESLLQYQVRAGEMELDLVVWLLDVLRYGIGVLGNYWHEELIPLREYVKEAEVINGVATGNSVTVVKHSITKGYEGNKAFSILPYDILPDPRVPFIKLQDGEFFGRKFKISWNTFKKGIAADMFFNEEQVKGLFGMGGDSSDRIPQMEQAKSGDSTTSPNGQKVGMANAIEIYIDLIPKDWGLGESIYPEKWVFTVLEKKVIIGASPLGYYHNKFPFHVLECEVDGYKQNSRGMLEIAAPLNDVMTWLFDSHMYNKRQVMNNQFVVDPSLIVMKDATSKNPGKMIRLKPTAFGTDVRKAIHQLPVVDVTNQNYNDLQIVNSQMQQLTGINDDVAGRSAPSSRRSAAEFRGTTTFAANRLANMAYYFSITGFRSLGKCMISSSQQMYDVEMKVKIAGDNVKGAQSITVTPEDMAGSFDISAIDGTMPLDRMSQAQFWMQVLQMISADPELAMQYRKADIFAYMARLGGLRGIDKFKFQVVSDEELVAMIKMQMLEGVGGGQQTNPAPAGNPAGATGVETAGAEMSGGLGELGGLQTLLGAG